MKQKTNTENIPLSVSVPDDAVCLLWLSADMLIYIRFCLLANLSPFSRTSGSSSLVIRDYSFSNASSDAGGTRVSIPIGFHPCQSVHSAGQKKLPNQLYAPTAALVRQFSFFMIFYQKLYHIFKLCQSSQAKLFPFFHIQRNRLAFLFIFLNFFIFTI